VDRSIPPFLRQQLGELLLWQWIGILLCLLAGVVLGLAVASLVRRLVDQVVRRTPVPWDDEIARSVYTPTKLWCGVVATFLLIRTLELPATHIEHLAKLTRAGTIAAFVWALIRALYAIAEWVADGGLSRETMDHERLARARSLRTQVIVATRVVSVLLFVVGTALVALQFNVVRSVGMSLLASAGVAGVALGFAAQKSLGALLAGIQISVSQPIRIGDAVNMQGEFGTIEDIGLTFVTLKLWDERRMIVPTPRFLEQPFLNMSRTHVGLLGTVFMRVDFDLPVSALRAEFEQLMDKEPKWDGRVKSLQVTDAGEKALEIRMLVSARDPGELWDLRVSVREKLVTWLQTFERGAHMPRTRLVMDAPNAKPALEPGGAA
jgi:small-conductance mechanosensitive channel